MIIDPKAEDDAIYVGHYHGSNRMIEERTGYAHNTKVFEPLQVIISKILDSGLNVMIIQSTKNKIVFIDDGHFHQR